LSFFKVFFLCVFSLSISSDRCQSFFPPLSIRVLSKEKQNGGNNIKKTKKREGKERQEARRRGEMIDTIQGKKNFVQKKNKKKTLSFK
jgi:hypothetical protein